MSMIRDIFLANEGRYKIEWVKAHMPLLKNLEETLSKTKPLAGKRLVVTMHLEAKTAYLAIVLKNAGAEIAVTGSNPLSTQDDVAAALAEEGVAVYAWYNCTSEEYDIFLNKALDIEPHIIVDDGGDLVHLLHTSRRELIPGLLGGCEETTTGVVRLHSLEKESKLAFPMIAVNDCQCKYLFDNRYGTGQSTWDGVMRTTNLTVVGKTVVVAGYGWCGKGVAMRAKGLGANVVITEVDPIKAIEAVFDGFSVLPMEEAAKIGDIFLTLTGCKDVITSEHFSKMKNGALMANAGHFDVEINKKELEADSISKKVVRKNIEEYTLENGNKVYLLAEGRLVNLAAGDGHPTEIMDLSFAMQTKAVLYILEKSGQLENKVYTLPKEIDQEVALFKLTAMGFKIDELTVTQRKYLEETPS
jgi:adenosylhomocysteinase